MLAQRLHVWYTVSDEGHWTDTKDTKIMTYIIHYRDCTGAHSTMYASDVESAEDTARWLETTGASDITVESPKTA